MTELVTPTAGSSILMASAYDERFPLDTLLTREDKSLWITTGMFPHELVLQFGSPATIRSITTVTANVKHLVVERCDKAIATSWEKILDIELDDNDGHEQVESNPVPSSKGQASFLKVRILAGWGDFSAVHSLSVLGHRDAEVKGL